MSLQNVSRENQKSLYEGVIAQRNSIMMIVGRLQSHVNSWFT